jgi:mono/diheme cytochrome c family protein
MVPRLAVLVAACTVVSAEDLATQARRILDANCTSCHGAARMSGLDLRSRESLLQGGKRGAAVVAGKSSESLLLKAVLRQGELQMPPGKKSLDPADVKVLREWIDAGAQWSSSTGSGEPGWWSFRKLRRPPVPASPEKNPIDAFVNAKLREKGLTPAPPAGRRTLIRRAYYDLLGLPPTPAEVGRFVNDPSPDAWPKLIETLLASPHYGERWGRHWLDVVRYADTGGFETDIYFPNAWRYRDYVIKSFNDDKPYNTFVQEQIAGDELWPDNLDLAGGFAIPKEKLRHLEARIGTGMYTIGPVYHEAAFQGDQVRYEWLTDVVDTTSEAFLGVTMGCSRCHDHKFDPFTRRDYHAMMAIFAASEEREVPVVSKFSIFGFKSGYPNWLDVEELKGAIHRIDQAARKRVVDKVRARFPKQVLDAYDIQFEKRTPSQRELAAQLERALTDAGLQENAQGKKADSPYTAEESKQREKLIYDLGQAALKANPVLQTATILGRADLVPAVHLTSRGDWRSKGEIIAPALPAVLSRGETVNDAARRKSLALWLTEPDHPLTARVIVNRAWHWHFGRGIVATPGDFGRQGEEPSDQALLDWVASEFVSQGWSLKKLHRLILTSKAYQRSSAAVESDLKLDPQNRYLWRMNRQRVDAETLRDSILAVAGTLNPKMGGRPVVPPLTEEEYSSLWARNQWPVSLDPAEHTRRSVYLYVKRTFPIPMLSTFDEPDTSVSCARRDATTVAPQALTMMNSEFMLSQAKHLAGRVRKDAGGDPDQSVTTAFRYALGRAPSAAELKEGRAFLQSDSSPDSLAHFVLVVLNMNEFLYVD